MFKVNRTVLFGGGVATVVFLGAFFGARSLGASPVHHQPTVNHSAAPGNTPAPSATPATSTYAQWAQGPGYTDMRTVQSDFQQITADTDNGNTAALASDGTQLSADAGIAMKNYPPVDSTQYILAMGAYASAGQDMESGNYSGAAKLMSFGTAEINQVEAAISSQQN